MQCPDCGAATVSFPVPPAAEGLLPDDRPGVAVCTRCLAARPSDDPDTDDPSAVSDAFPAGTDGALLGCLLALVDDPATYREELRALVGEAELRGIDVFLFLDRLADDPALDPVFDVRRRRGQLEQLV
jgi:hypothetical protein